MGINVNGALEVLYGSLQSLFRSLIPIVAPLKIGAVRIRVF